MNNVKILPLLVLVIFVLSIASLGYAKDAQNTDGIQKVSKDASNTDVQRVYFKIKANIGKSLVKNMIRHDFGNIVSIETSKRNIETLKKNKNLEFLGEVPVYRVQAVSPETRLPMQIPESDGGGGAIIVQSNSTFIERACNNPNYQPNYTKVSYGVRYMYENFVSNMTNTSGGAGVKVAVLDTGANIAHPDLANRVRYCVDTTTDPKTVGSCGDGYDLPFGHGTPIASVIAADSGSDNLGMYGVAPETDLYIMKVCSNSGYCSDDDVAAGINDAVSQSVNIITMSFGGPGFSAVVKNAIDNAYSNNILLVAAAGNAGYPYYFTSILYPAAYSKVISVGAIDQNFNHLSNSLPGVNDGDYVREEREIEFGAPGINIVMAAAEPLGPGGCSYYYENMGGTSFAAPHVTGLAAKLWNGNAFETRARLQASARLKDVGAPGDDPYAGFGLPTVHVPQFEYAPIDINPWNTLPRSPYPR